MSRRVHVCRYARRRIRPVKILMTEPPRPTVIRDPTGRILSHRLGGAFPRGSQAENREVGVFLAAHIPSLQNRAKKLSLELKEAHVRDDVMETIVHETMHATLEEEGIRDELIAIFGGDKVKTSKAEEAIVNMLAMEALEDVREEPKIWEPRRRLA